MQKSHKSVNRPACLFYPRVAILSLIVMVGSLMSQPAMAALCSGVFPKDSTEQSVAKLDLGIMDRKPGKDYKPFPTAGITLAPGDYFYVGDKLKTKAAIKLSTPGQQVRIFIEGDTEFAAHSEINMGGSAADLLIVVRGDLSIGTKNRINALIYVAGDTDLNPDVHVSGALTAEGSVSTKVKDAIDYDKVAAEKFSSGELCTPDGAAVVDHFKLSFLTPRLSCEPIQVEIFACADSACSSTVAINHTIYMKYADRWLGGGEVIFEGADRATAYLKRKTEPPLLGVGVAGEKYQCSNGAGSCELTILESGFKMEVPDLIAGKPDTLTISAVRKDDNSLQCVPAFADVDRPVQLRGAYIDPSPTEQVGGHLIQVNGSSVSTPGVTLNLYFDSNGQAAASLRYADAGKMQLKATYQGTAAGGDEDLIMEGVAQFISRPYGLHIEYENGGHGCVATTIAACDKLRAAGYEFALDIRAVAWLYDNQPLSDLAGNPTTPNFRLSNIPLTSHVEAPAGLGSQGSWSPGEYNHALGVRTSLQVSQSEVGIFKFRAEASNYFGFLVAGENLRVGRFVPDYLEVSGQAEMDSCDGFSYQREPVPYLSGEEPRLLVKAFNRAGQPTLNYDLGEFWRLPRPLGTYWTQSGGRQLPTGELKLLAAVEDQVGDDDGDGERTFLWKGNGWIYDSGSQTPGPDDLPFSIEQHFVLKEGDEVCVRRSGESSCLGKDEPFVLAYTGSEIRLGRLKIGNAHGSELQELDLPWVIESWQNTAGATGFQKETLDLCTATSSLPNALGVPALSQTLGDLKTVANQLIDLQSGNLHLDAPGVPGSVSVSFPDLRGWLHYDWNGDGKLEDDGPSGLATFGIYKGHEKIIFRREVIGR